MARFGMMDCSLKETPADSAVSLITYLAAKQMEAETNGMGELPAKDRIGYTDSNWGSDKKRKFHVWNFVQRQNARFCCGYQNVRHRLSCRRQNCFAHPRSPYHFTRDKVLMKLARVAWCLPQGKDNCTFQNNVIPKARFQKLQDLEGATG